MFGNDRAQMRRFFATAWQKHLDRSPMEPLERLVAEVVAQHPEYHTQIGDPERVEHDYPPENGQTNPFLHMGMHITLAEQLSGDRPAGIRALYQRIAQASGDPHMAEHRLMDCLGLILWEAQRAGRMPDEQAYIACVKKIAG